MKNVFKSLACLCIALLACACNNDVQESAPETPNFYADDEEHSDLTRGDGTGRAIILKVELGTRDKDTGKCNEDENGICRYSLTYEPYGISPRIDRDGFYPLEIDINPETKEMEGHVDIPLKSGKLKDPAALTHKPLLVTEDIVGVYDTNILKELYDEKTIETNQDIFAAIPHEIAYEFVLVQNEYLFDATLGLYGGYRLNIEIVKK